MLELMHALESEDQDFHFCEFIDCSSYELALKKQASVLVQQITKLNANCITNILYKQRNQQILENKEKIGLNSRVQKKYASYYEIEWIFCRKFDYKSISIQLLKPNRYKMDRTPQTPSLRTHGRKDSSTTVPSQAYSHDESLSQHIQPSTPSSLNQRLVAIGKQIEELKKRKMKELKTTTKDQQLRTLIERNEKEKNEKLRCIIALKRLTINHLQNQLQEKKKQLLKVTTEEVNKYEETDDFPEELNSSYSLQQVEISHQHSISSTYYLPEAKLAFEKANSPALLHIQKNMNYFLGLKQYVHKIPIKQKVNMRPASKGKKTIVFDLDETLIHCNESLKSPYDAQFILKKSNDSTEMVRISIRPYAQQLLENLSKYFELIAFSASQSHYGNQIIKILDPEGRYFQYKFFRQHCSFIKNRVYAKDLRTLNRDLSDTVLVDNAAYSFLLQPNNGIPIIPYFNNKDDKELWHLEAYLMELRDVRDVREWNKEYFKLQEYANFSEVRSLIKELYL